MSFRQYQLARTAEVAEIKAAQKFVKAQLAWAESVHAAGEHEQSYAVLVAIARGLMDTQLFGIPLDLRVAASSFAAFHESGRGNEADRSQHMYWLVRALEKFVAVKY